MTEPKNVLKTAAALFAAAAIVVLLGTVTVARAASPSDGRFVTTALPNSPAGQQMQWLIDASARLPLSEAEIRAHFAKSFLALPGYSPAQTNAFLSAAFGGAGAQLKGVLAMRNRAIAAVVTGRDGREFSLTVVLAPSGLIGYPTGMSALGVLPPTSLPSPSGKYAIGSDVLQVIDRSRGGRRLMVTRWFPATAAARRQPLVEYASPRLSSVLGLPRVRVHAHAGAHALPGRLPVVLFSPGSGVPRVIYQALAEDLASHGYLVISVDHTGEAATQFPDGHVDLPASWTDTPTSEAATIRTRQRTRVLDMKLLLRRLGTMPRGPVPDMTRIASIGHSLGGSTSAALMRVDSRIRAGIDIDGSIFGGTEKQGVSRPFMVLAEVGLDHSVRALLEHSTGPRFEVTISGLQHMAFSDGPALWPRQLDRGKWRSSSKDIVIQRVYVRAFLDRYLLGTPSHLLDRPSPRYPRAKLTYAARNAAAPVRQVRCRHRTTRADRSPARPASDGYTLVPGGRRRS